MHRILLVPASCRTWVTLEARALPRAARSSSSSSSDKNTSRHRTRNRGFLDRCRIRVSGGTGGRGATTYRSIGKYKRRPDGGHGGNGGSVIIVADHREKSCLRGLVGTGHHFSAKGGGNGGSNMKHGRNGQDVVIRVPCGVVVKKVMLEEEEEGEEEMSNLNKRNGKKDDIHPYVNYRGNHDPDFDDDEDTDHDIGDSDGEYDSDESESEETSEDDTDDPVDYVNTGTKAPDGFFYWEPNEVSNLVPGSPWTSGDDGDDDDDDDVGHTRHYKRVVLADLDKPNSYAIVATGGRGGTGIGMLAGRQYHNKHRLQGAARSVPQRGETAFLELELKLIADVGLVGYPNAGKSTLLGALSKATPEIAPYPFTTLHPLVGRIEYRDGAHVSAADVPGLIEGAASGRGRGMDFLRHLERTKALLYMVDAGAALEGVGRNPVRDFNVLVNELTIYDRESGYQHQNEDEEDVIGTTGAGGSKMMERPALVVVNKLDLIKNEEQKEEILFNVGLAAEESGIRMHGREVIGISAGVSGEGLMNLSRAIRQTVIQNG